MSGTKKTGIDWLRHHSWHTGLSRKDVEKYTLQALEDLIARVDALSLQVRLMQNDDRQGGAQ